MVHCNDFRETQFKDNTKDGQKAAAALDKVTDHVEEKETEISAASKLLLLIWNIIYRLQQHRCNSVNEKIKCEVELAEA